MHETETETDAGAVLLWFPGTPHTGAVPSVLADAAAEHGLRVVAVTRPGHAGRASRPGRSVADEADVGALLDGLGAIRAVALGYSGGGPHALAAAALRPDRVVGVAAFASPAPFADAAWWWDGMAAPGGLRAATGGRAARLAYAAHDDFDPDQFVDTDWDALRGDLADVGSDAGAAGPTSVEGTVDDDVAFVTPWGVDLADVRAPTWIHQGTADRVIPPAHGRAIAASVPGAVLVRHDDAGHVAVLTAIPEAIRMLAAAARG
jgi:pimeloyl-ACP methyl ester carboxylesterase